MSAAYTTRAEAEALPGPLIEAMARAAYDATRTPSFPAWADVTDGYRRDVRKSMTAAIKAAEGLGYRVVGS
jgi:hypothetical protein